MRTTRGCVASFVERLNSISTRFPHGYRAPPGEDRLPSWVLLGYSRDASRAGWVTKSRLGTNSRVARFGRIDRDVIADLDRLQTAEVGQDGKRFLLRSEVQGTCGLVFQAAGVAVPPTVQRVAPSLDNQEADPSATPPL